MDADFGEDTGNTKIEFTININLFAYMLKKILSNPATSLTSFLLSLFFAFIALPLLVPVLFEFASLFAFQFGVLSVLFFIFGLISFLIFIIDKERGLVPKIIFGALSVPLIFIFLNTFYAEAKKVYKERESSWSPFGAIVEKFLPRNYTVTSNPNDAGAGESASASPEIEKLIFAESNVIDSNNRKIIFFQLDNELNKKVINEINTLDYGFEGFAEGGKAFVLAKYNENQDAIAYYYSKIGKGSSLEEIGAEKARWLLADPEGRLSPDRKKMIDYSPPNKEGKYFSFEKDGGREELLSGYYPPGSTDNRVENVLWIDDQNIVWDEYNPDSATTGIKTMNLLSREKQFLVKISETNANSGARIWSADPEKILISSFGNAGQTFSAPDGKIIYEVPASTTQSRSEIYIFSLKDKSLRRLTDNSPYTDFYDKDLVVSLNHEKAFCLAYDKLIIVDLQEPWKTKTHFVNGLAAGDGDIEGFAFAQ